MFKLLLGNKEILVKWIYKVLLVRKDLSFIFKFKISLIFFISFGRAL